MARAAYRTEGGFTVVELLMVVALSAMVMTMVAGPAAKQLDRGWAKAAENEILAAHTLAWSLAVQYGRPTKLAFTGDKGPEAEGRYSGLEVIADTTSNRMGAEVVHRFELARGAFVANHDLLCFNAAGIPTDDGKCGPADATVAFEHDGRRDTIRFATPGQPVP